MTAGPWRPVFIQAYEARIDDLRAIIDVKEDLSIRTDVSFKIKGSASGLKAKYSLLSTDGKSVLSDDVAVSDGEGKAFFEGDSSLLDLWYPTGYGKQALYTIQITVSDEVRENISLRRQNSLKLNRG